MLRAPKGFIDETDPKVCQVGHPAPPWMSSYADLMTELVCFFVILYALSAALNKNVQNAAQEVKEMMDKGEMKGEVKIDKDGLKITLEEQGKASFFSSGSADTTAEIDAMLRKLAPVLQKLTEQHEIIVEGHTDNQPISNEYYDSNWELSTARATSVARLMIDKYGFPPSRMGAVGFGEFRPLVSNDSPDNRARNRRVVFFVKGSPIAKGKGGVMEASVVPTGVKKKGTATEVETKPAGDAAPVEKAAVAAPPEEETAESVEQPAAQ